MKKRGHLVPMMVFSILAAVLVMVMFQKVAHALATNEQFFKQFQAYEIKFLLHTLYATPGDAVVRYPGNTSSYTYEFETNRITIYSSDIDTKYEKGISLLVPFKDNAINKKLSEPKQLIFISRARKVDVGDETILDTAHHTCELIDENPKKSILILEPKKEDEALAILLIENLKTPPAPFAIAKTIQPGDRINEEDVYIQISIGEYDNGENPIKIHFRSGSAAARRLACLIANQVAKDFGVAGYSMIPSDEPDLKDGISLHIEVGNRNIYNNPLFDMKKLSTSMKKAFEEW